MGICYSRSGGKSQSNGLHSLAHCCLNQTQHHLALWGSHDSANQSMYNKRRMWLKTSLVQERMKDSQEQLQLITQQMNQLMQEKAELETRNKILEQVVRLSVEHVDQLQLNKVSSIGIIYRSSEMPCFRAVGIPPCFAVSEGQHSCIESFWESFASSLPFYHCSLIQALQLLKRIRQFLERQGILTIARRIGKSYRIMAMLELRWTSCLQQVLEIEQSMLMETYTEFVSKVEQKPKVSADRAREWLMGQVLFKYFQVNSSALYRMDGRPL